MSSIHLYTKCLNLPRLRSLGSLYCVFNLFYAIKHPITRTHVYVTFAVSTVLTIVLFLFYGHRSPAAILHLRWCQVLQLFLFNSPHNSKVKTLVSFFYTSRTTSTSGERRVVLFARKTTHYNNNNIYVFFSSNTF